MEEGRVDEISDTLRKSYLKAAHKDLAASEKAKAAIGKKENKGLAAHLAAKSHSSMASRATSKKSSNFHSSSASRNNAISDQNTLSGDEHKTRKNLTRRINNRHDGIGRAEHSMKENLDEVLGKENDIGTPALTKKYKAMTPGQEKAQIPVTEGTWIVSGQHQEQGHVRSKTYKATSKDHAISQFHDDHGEDNYSITKTRQLDKLKGESVEEALTEVTRSPTITVRENGKEKKVKHADYHKDMQALMAGRMGIAAFKKKHK